ncbi:MAG TPA: autotransporter outer membrane beta-barrel domain-containing protein, partial [Gemmatimonadales bacterium]|nr:autotransporter outer membrane beta-barrel domain-containing protein [Gemmatimonadales bacterium]
FSAKDNQDEVSSHALAGQVGVGYEVPMGRSLSIVPFANFLGSTGGNIRFNNTVTDLSANTSLLQFGVGLTLH